MSTHLTVASNSSSNDAPAAEPMALSIIVPTFDTCTDPHRLITVYRRTLDQLGQRPLEVILVGGPGTRDRVESARAAAGDWAELVAIETSVAPDEEEALKLGIARADGEFVLTLPGWRTPGEADFQAVFSAFNGHDMVTGTFVDPETGASTWRRRLFHRSVTRLFGAEFHDLFCRVRLGRREVFEETVTLGVRQHFIPVVADWRGFKVSEAYLTGQGTEGSGLMRNFSLVGHFRAFVDLMMLYVVLKFLHRPLRFFSAIGAPLVLLGTLITGYLVIARALQMTSLVDRPLLTFGVLFLVLGVQVIAIGLIGEIIVYTSNRRSKTYEVDTVLRSDDDPAGPTGGDQGGEVGADPAAAPVQRTAS